MKRLLLFLALAALAAVAIPVAAGAAPKFEKANGTGDSSSYGHVHVNAKDQGDGPRGHFFIGFGPGDTLQGDATCITVDGNVALVGGFDRATGNMPFLIEVTDNGSPGHDNDRHRWRVASPGEVSGPDCDEFGNNPPPATITQGNYVVNGG